MFGGGDNSSPLFGTLQRGFTVREKERENGEGDGKIKRQMDRDTHSNGTCGGGD